jgi:ribosomal protein S18 acetylase RimI-like enzyme
MTALSLDIRRARPTDTDRLRELHHVAMLSADEYVADAPDEDLQDLESHYYDRDGEFLVGTLDGTIVAMGAYAPPGEVCRADASGRTMELCRMRVDPSHQRRGFGRQVYTVLERRARKAGVETLVLNTGRSQRRAQEFYERIGFERVRTERFTVGSESMTLVCYRKRL